MKRFQKLDDRRLVLFRKRDKPFPLRPRFTRVMQNRFGNGGEITPMAIGGGVADVPEFAREELIHRHAALNQPLVAEERILIITDDMPLQICVGADEGTARRSSFQSRTGTITSQIKADGAADLLRLQISWRIEGIRLGEKATVQRERGLVTIGAANLGK